MPIYEFQCMSCNREFDELVRSADEIPSVKCPGCGHGRIERKISVFAAHAASEAPRCPLSPELCGGCAQSEGACGLA